ncbi:MAG: 50S ribosomal protein L6 [Candidatus Omnitrophica bacterium CG11_big_fil_rev_8_21_14_0_20_63_9]|nr:MAG: 50S ribosomal protein L6 [Candidatus Omnitrophica bacterium CG11_big_fil_rev_8_21_14_0_20_63_9]
MSRIGRAPIAIPSGVKVTQQDSTVRVEGPKGKLSFTLPSPITIKLDGQQVKVECPEGSEAGALHGLSRALLANMVQGVTSGFSKEMEIVGVGYRAQLQGKQLALSVGLTHQVIMPIPEGLTVEVPKPTSVIVKGADKQQVGQFAATMRRAAPPEPYKGKGIKYAGEVIRRKAGKAATGAGAKAGG